MMYRILSEILNDPLGLPVADLWEYALLALLAAVAFGVGWRVSAGSLACVFLHWVARLLAFFVLWGAMYALLAAVQWIIAHLVLVCSTVLMAVAVLVIASVNGLGGKNRHYREVTV